MSDLVLMEKVKNPEIDIEKFLKNMYKWMVQCNLETYTIPPIKHVEGVPLTLDGILDMLVDIKIEQRKQKRIQEKYFE